MLARKWGTYGKVLRFLKAHSYQVIHINTSNMFAEIPVLCAAKKVGIATRIIHSHNSSMGTDHPVKRMLLKCRVALDIGRGIVAKLATHYFACSQLAAEWLFPAHIVESGKVMLVKNGIDSARFQFNREIREKYRSEMGLTDKFVVGNVGRFSFAKNHTFLLDIFAEIHKRKPESVLLLIGEGELEEEVQKKTDDLHLTDCVCFLGLRSDVNCLLQTMDVFVLPSFFEGLPIVAIEAQAAGLEMVMSDAVSREAGITELAEFISLDQEAEVWADRILQLYGYSRRNMCEEIMAAGYDMAGTAKWVESFYLR